MNVKNIPGFHTRMTEDMSLTIFNEGYDEAMHTHSGAYNESLVKHVGASGILNNGNDTACVLDIGFGIGYNILALLTEMSKKRPGFFINIVSLERTRDYLPLMESIVFNDERDTFFEPVKIALGSGFAESKNCKIRVLMGDARETIKTLEDTSFDAVFHDPFSHLKNPELWSVEFLREEYRVMNNAGVLTTYSAAPQVRTGLLEAGFLIGRGPQFGNKKGATLAAKREVIKSFEVNEIVELKKNPQSIPYRDMTGKDSKDEILERWHRDLASKEHHRARRE